MHLHRWTDWKLIVSRYRVGELVGTVSYHVKECTKCKQKRFKEITRR